MPLGLFFFISLGAQNLPATIYELYGLKKGGCDYDKTEERMVEEVAEMEAYPPPPPPPPGTMVGTPLEIKQAFSDFRTLASKVANPVTFKDKKLNNGNICFNENGKWGLKNKSGEVILSPQFDHIFPDTTAKGFSGYIGAFCNYYSPQGKKIVANDYYHIQPLDKTSFIVRSTNGYGLIINGEIKLEANNQMIQRAKSGTDIYYKVRTGAMNEFVLKDDLKTRIPIGFWDTPTFVGENHVLFWNNILDIKNKRKLICEQGFEFKLLDKDAKIAAIKKSRERFYYIIDFEGNIISQEIYSNLQAFNKAGIAAAGIQNTGQGRRFSQKFGLINKKGKWIVPAEYANIYPRDEIWMVANKDRKLGLMNNKGKLIAPVEYDRITSLDDNEYLCTKQTKEGDVTTITAVIFNAKKKKFQKKQYPYLSIRKFKSCNPEHFVATVVGGEQIIDKKLKPITPVHGRIFHHDGKYIGADFNVPEVGRTKVFYDCDGKRIPVVINGEKIDTFSEIKKINKDLSYLELTNGEAILVLADGSSVKTDNKLSYFYPSGWQEFLITGERGGDKYGLIDQKGQVIIPMKFKHLGSFIPETGMAVFSTYNKKSGLVTSKGEFFQEKLYDNIRYLGFGLYRIEQRKKMGVMDKNGNIVLPVKYGYLYLHNGMIKAGIGQNEYNFDCTGAQVRE